jgi:hypothetical protein
MYNDCLQRQTTHHQAKKTAAGGNPGSVDYMWLLIPVYKPKTVEDSRIRLQFVIFRPNIKQE